MDLENFQVLRQGAEGRLHVGPVFGLKAIVKERFPKKYRHPELDRKLIKDRVKAEVRALVKCKAIGVRTPTIYLTDVETGIIAMEYLDGCPTVCDVIRAEFEAENRREPFLVELAGKIGGVVAAIHAANIVHGDLTTSNMLVEDSTKKICLIDFGLGHTEGDAEDMGVDLYVLERALTSAHPRTEFMFEAILAAYTAEMPGKLARQVIAKYEEVRLRGRKRDMTG